MLLTAMVLVGVSASALVVALMWPKRDGTTHAGRGRRRAVKVMKALAGWACALAVALLLWFVVQLDGYL